MVPSPKYPDVKVAMRQINLSKNSATKNFSVYDTSGVYTDENFINQIDINRGLPKIRKNWILERGDVETYDGRQIKPEDNGKDNDKGKKIPQFDLSNHQI